MATFAPNNIINLNVGGQRFEFSAHFISKRRNFSIMNDFRFSTSTSTLTWCPDSFFSALLSGRIPSLRDENNAIFIDRDPKLFSIILNYLRTKEIDLKDTDLTILRHEAEFYNISPLVKRLMLCEEMDESSCGDVLFYGYLQAVEPPESDNMAEFRKESVAKSETNVSVSSTKETVTASVSTSVLNSTTASTSSGFASGGRTG